MKKYVGLAYDKLTTPVMNRIIQDVTACLSVASRFRVPLTICVKSPNSIKKLFPGYNLQYSSDLSKPRIFLNYKVGEVYEIIPDTCRHEIRRDLFEKKKGSNLKLGVKHGHPLKEDIRYSFSNTGRMFNHPNGYAPPDAALVMMWGPVKA